jgi:hypothetical protein
MGKWKLTPECGQTWNPVQLAKWSYGWKLRVLENNGRRVGVALGPIMLFWDFS